MQYYDTGLLYRSLVKYLAQIAFQGVLSTAVRPVQQALYHPLLCMSSPYQGQAGGVLSRTGCSAWLHGLDFA